MVTRVVLLALSEGPLQTSDSDAPLSVYEFDRFADELRDAGFTVEMANRWPDAGPGSYWLFFHANPATQSVAGQIETRYGKGAPAKTVVFNQLYPRGFAAVNAGIALSVGMEAYGDWLRGEVMASDQESFVITTRQRASDRALPVMSAQGQAVMLAGGTPLPQLLWQCLKD